MFSNLRHRQHVRLIYMLLPMVLAAASFAAAQTTNASIRGKVTDETGASLPGVTATVTSPAMLVPSMVVVSDAEGNYTLPDLPIGQYRVAFELAGFQRFVREQIQLTAGFTATINVVMKIGSIEESVTVSGESPVVDLKSTTPAVSLSNQVLTEVIPAQRNLLEFLATTPGVVPTRKADLIGGSQQSTGRVYGMTGQVTVLVDGVNARQGADAAGMTPDLASLEEFQVVPVAGSAEQGLPGVFVNAIVKSGGNDFHGRYEIQGAHRRFVGDNLTPALEAQGLTSGDAMQYALETTGDLGGRIIRDKLWFYGAGRYQTADRMPLGYSAATGPDGVYNTSDDVQGVQHNYMENETVKATYQAARQYKVIGFLQHNAYTANPQTISRTLPLEATQIHHNNPHQIKVEIQGTPSNRFLFNFMLGRNRYLARYYPQDGFDDKPTTTDNTTLIQTGPAINVLLRPRQQWQPVGSMTLFPGGIFAGQHEIKVGFQHSRQYQGNGFVNARHGNYRLIFDTIGGVPHQPFQIITYNYPVHPRNHMNETGVYAQDTWRLSDRVTLNLGIRYDQFHTWVPEQTKEPSQFSAGGTFPRIETGTWKELAPRAGIAYTLTADGRTVVKATYGRYNHTVGDDFGSAYNRNTEIATTYRWRDLNGNGDYDPGEVNLDTNGPDFVNITAAANNLLNPELKDPFTQTASLTLERELMANFGARVNYIYIRQSNLIETVNVLRPYSAWNVPLPRQDPGPDGVLGNADDGGIFTIHDYNPAFRGSNFVGNQRVNRPRSRDNRVQTIEAVLTKRTTNGWGMLASFMALKNHRYLAGVVQSPNDEINDLDKTWDWQGKLTGSYELPMGVSLSSTYQLYAGIKGQRTYLFRGLPSASTVTIRVEDFGNRASSVRSLLNLRIGKDIRAVRLGRLRVSLDVLNVLNNASPWAVSYTSGPTFGQISSIDSPRILHGSVAYSF